jgi:hypothetical protein
MLSRPAVAAATDLIELVFRTVDLKPRASQFFGLSAASSSSKNRIFRSLYRRIRHLNLQQYPSAPAMSTDTWAHLQKNFA